MNQTGRIYVNALDVKGGILHSGARVCGAPMYLRPKIITLHVLGLIAAPLH